MGSTIGSTWRPMIEVALAPNVRAASTNTRLCSSADSARAVRRYTGMRVIASTRTMFAALGENT